LAVPLYADFETEGAVVAKYIQNTYPNAKIGVLYQNDNFGKDHVRGLRAGLGTKASQIVAVASYELSDPAIDSQIITDSMSAAKADGRPPTSVPGQDRPV
jgi:branched-chain amino acid transport system substrate-binding protein